MHENRLYIGRVGALAVALGVGLAVANSPCIASAHPGHDHSDSADSAGRFVGSIGERLIPGTDRFGRGVTRRFRRVHGLDG